MIDEIEFAILSQVYAQGFIILQSYSAEPTLVWRLWH